MNAVDFPERNAMFGEGQPEYVPIPAFADGRNVVFCWELSDDEIAKLIVTRKLWHTVLTGGSPLQPQLLKVNKEEHIQTS